MTDDIHVGEVVFVRHLGSKTFGLVTSIELDGVGVMLPSGEVVTREEKLLEVPPEHLRAELNAMLRDMRPKRGLR